MTQSPRTFGVICGFLFFVVILPVGAVAAAITSSPKLPPTMPWDVKKLSEPPAFEWIQSSGPVKSLLYEGEPYGGKKTRVFAYYATPEIANGGHASYPAVVLIHGGGGTAFREWVELWAKRGYAAIAMDLAGYRPIEGENPHQRENRERLADGGPDQGDEEKFGKIDAPAVEQWSYHAVAAVIRAHSLICSFAEVDADRTAVTGISWGGYLTSIVAGIDNRFLAAVPVYGCGYLHENSAWLNRFEKMTPEQRERWVSLWDPSKYLPAVSMPILFVNGTNDFAYPLDSYMKSYDTVPGAKQLRITVNMQHGHPAGWAPMEIGLFIDHYLRGSEGLPVVGELEIRDGRLRVECKSSLRLVAAALHWTTGAEPINQRAWQTLPASVEGNSVTALAPAGDTTAWFLSVTDERGAVVSSRVTLRNEK